LNLYIWLTARNKYINKYYLIFYFNITAASEWWSPLVIICAVNRVINRVYYCYRKVKSVSRARTLIFDQRNHSQFMFCPVPKCPQYNNITCVLGDTINWLCLCLSIRIEIYLRYFRLACTPKTFRPFETANFIIYRWNVVHFIIYISRLILYGGGLSRGALATRCTIASGGIDLPRPFVHKYFHWFSSLFRVYLRENLIYPSRIIWYPPDVFKRLIVLFGKCRITIHSIEHAMTTLYIYTLYPLVQLMYTTYKLCHPFVRKMFCTFYFWRSLRRARRNR